MISRKLDKKEWKSFLDFLSKHFLGGKRAEVEVASLNLGDQVEVNWLPIVGIVYDHKDDIVEVALEEVGGEHFDHIIHKPREIYLAEDVSLFISLDIIDADGRHHIIKVKDPLMLPPRQTRESAPVNR